MTKIIVIAHNIRSAHNIGSLLRTCDGLSIDEVYLTGYTPYPSKQNDTRLPHISQRISKLINKTALGAEKYVSWRQQNDIQPLIAKLRSKKYIILGLEIVPEALPLQSYSTNKNIALIIGNEKDGIDEQILEQCDSKVFIPMLGKKESLNVTEAASMALYYLRYIMNNVK